MKSKLTWIFVFLITFSINSFGQDTIFLKKIPNVILHSWFPEYKASPKYKIGDTKIIMTLTPDLDSTKLRNCKIELRPKNNFIEIRPTGKIYPSQFVVKVNKTSQKFTEFEAWLLIDDKIIMVMDKGKYVNIKEFCLTEQNKVKIDTIKVELIK